MKLTKFDKQIINQAKRERARLKRMMVEMSTKALAQSLGVSVGCVNNYLDRSKNRLNND